MKKFSFILVLMLAFGLSSTNVFAGSYTLFCPPLTVTSKIANTNQTKIANFTIENKSSSDDVKITSITIVLQPGGSSQYKPVPALSDLQNLIVENNTYILGPVIVMAKDTNVFSVNLTITAGTSITIDVYSDFGIDTAGSIGAGCAATGIWSKANTLASDTVIKQTLIFGNGNVTGIKETEFNKTTVSVYPNPATSEINVQVSEKTNFTLTNISGKVIFQKDISAGENIISTSDLPAGIYIWQTISGIQKQAGKIVVQH